MTPQVFQILLSLAEGPRHGYAIITDVRDRTGGEVQLTASTLYDALARLVDHQLISEASGPRADAGATRARSRSAPLKEDSRRRYYQLTPQGRAAAREESQRLARVLAMAKAKRFLT